MSVKLAYQPLVFCSFSLTATPKQIGEIHKNDDHGISNQVGHRMTLIKNNLVNYKIVTRGNCQSNSSQLCNKLQSTNSSTTSNPILLNMGQLSGLENCAIK